VSVMQGTPGSRREGEAGFSLIELMVVVLIIGILIAIAIPVFFGARTRAADRAAQTDVRSALVAALSYYTSSDTFTGFDVADGVEAEPELGWVVGGSAPAVGEIGIEVASGGQLLLVTRSKSTTYFCLAQVPGSPVTQRGQDADWNNVNTVAGCDQGW
jgi:type IV pilus assembly protein PilA